MGVGLGRLIFQISAFFFSFFMTSPLCAAERLLKEGRYSGFIYLKEAGFKLPTELDTIYIPAKDEDGVRLAAFVKVSFGGFRSHEYLTHFYLVDDYDWSADEMILDAVATGYSRDITVNAKVEDNGKRLKGIVTSRRGGTKSGEIELLYVSPVAVEKSHADGTTFENKEVNELYKDVPIYPLLTGAYESDCPDTKVLQFEVTKGGALSRSNVLPMEGYVVRGRIYGLGGVSENLELLHRLNTFEEFQYNFYRGHLYFPGLGLGLCKRGIDTIDCEFCKFKLVEQEKEFLKLITLSDHSCHIIPYPPELKNEEPISATTLTKDITGAQYSGYVHLEGRGTKRPFTVDVNVTGPPIPGDPTIARRLLTFTPKVHLQDPEDPAAWQRSLPIDISETSIGNPGDPFILIGEGGSILQIAQWTKNYMYGVWYSSSFGRVGTFWVARGDVKIPKIEINYPVPGTFLSKPHLDPKNRTNWLQEEVELDWHTSFGGERGGVSHSPHAVGGTYRVHWNRFPPFPLEISHNELLSEELNFVRFDPLTGFFGADLTIDRNSRNYLSLFGRMADDEIWVAKGSGVYFIEAGKFHHEFTKLSRNEPYAQVNFPWENNLEPNYLYVFLPRNSKLFINEKLMTRSQKANLRAFNIPELKPGIEVTYKLRALFKTGRTITHSVSFTPEQAKQKAIFIDFYKLQ